MPANRERAEGCSEGARPSGIALIALVDQADPAFLSVVGVLHEMRNAGIELDEALVTAAIAMGRKRHDPLAQQEIPSQRATSELSDASIVYYIRRANLVKIGTTERPYRRLAELLPDEVLAWEPGARAEEKARHRQFAEWRRGGSEYFETSTTLDRHVEELRQLHGEPDPDWPTLATVGAIRVKRDSPLPSPENPILVTIGEGAETLGVKRNTADMWVHRKMLVPAGANELGRPLYLLAHMNELAQRGGLLPHAAA